MPLGIRLPCRNIDFRRLGWSGSGTGRNGPGRKKPGNDPDLRLGQFRPGLGPGFRSGFGIGDRGRFRFRVFAPEQRQDRLGDFPQGHASRIRSRQFKVNGVLAHGPAVRQEMQTENQRFREDFVNRPVQQRSDFLELVFLSEYGNGGLVHRQRDRLAHTGHVTAKDFDVFLTANDQEHGNCPPAEPAVPGDDGHRKRRQLNRDIAPYGFGLRRFMLFRGSRRQGQNNSRKHRYENFNDRLAP